MQHNGGFCCLEPLEQRTFVTEILSGLAAEGDFLADFQLFFSISLRWIYFLEYKLCVRVRARACTRNKKEGV